MRAPNPQGTESSNVAKKPWGLSPPDPSSYPPPPPSKWSVHYVCLTASSAAFLSLIRRKKKFIFNSKPHLSQLLSNVALCPKAVLPKSCSRESLDLCTFAFQIIIWATTDSWRCLQTLVSPFLRPPGDHELARTCSASLAPDTAVLYPRPSVISNYCAHTSHSQRASYRMLRSLRRCVRSILALGFQGGFRSHLNRSTTPLPH